MTQLRIPLIDLWFKEPEVPQNLRALTDEHKNLKTVIMENIHKLDENCSVLSTQNVLSILPIKDRRKLRCDLFIPSLLDQVRPADFGNNQNIDRKVLEEICHHLMPVIYTEDTCIVEEGKAIGKMFLINKGVAVAYSNVGSSSCGCLRNQWLRKGDFYGKELLNWAFTSPSLSDLPISTKNVIAQGKVEAFAITASDLKSIVLKYWWLFNREVNAAQWEHIALESLRQRRRLHREGGRARDNQPPVGPVVAQEPAAQLIGRDLP